MVKVGGAELDMSLPPLVRMMVCRSFLPGDCYAASVGTKTLHDERAEIDDVNLMKVFGIFLMIFGAAFFCSCGGYATIFIRKDYLEMLEKYKRLRADGKQAGWHLRSVYFAHLSVVMGVPMMVLGLLLWLLGNLLGSS